jgi:hypothetical protein
MEVKLDDAATRKAHPIATGVLSYFPDALLAIAHVSWVGNEQHNPGMALHWDRAKSMDEADALIRHFLERGSLDTDGLRHTAKMAWRALALLQKEIEDERAKVDKYADPGAIVTYEASEGPQPPSAVAVVRDDHGHEAFVSAQKMGA